MVNKYQLCEQKWCCRMTKCSTMQK